MTKELSAKICAEFTDPIRPFLPANVHWNLFPVRSVKLVETPSAHNWINKTIATYAAKKEVDLVEAPIEPGSSTTAQAKKEKTPIRLL